MDRQPWLRSADWERTDPALATVAAQPLRMPHTSDLVDSLDIADPGVLVLRGPRQVGKSTFLRELAVRCLSEGIGGENLLLIDAERLSDRHELLGELESFLEPRTEHSVVLVDEVNSVDSWWRAVKQVVDGGSARNALIVTTGSSTTDLASGADLMPGRRGRRYPVDLELLPVPWTMVAERISLEEYFLTGGFPWSINEYLRSQTIPAYVYQLHASWIEGALLRNSHAVASLPYLLNSIADHVGNPLSAQKLTRDSGIGSNHTTESYLEVMERIFALLTVRWQEPGGGPPAPRKNRKLYPLDLFLFHLFDDYGKGWTAAFQTSRARVEDSSTVGRIVEALVASELRRRGSEKMLCYWLGKKEIDFVSPEIVEVKYRRHVSTEEFDWVVPRLGGRSLTVVTRDTSARRGPVRLVPLETWLREK